MLVYPQIIQILDHIRQLILERLEAALQLEKLRPHLLGKIIDSLLRVLDSDRWQYDDLVELCHIKMHRHLAMTDIEEKMPHEERPYRTGIRLHESFEIEDMGIVQRHHHAGFMQTLGVTLEILDGISVGMEDIGTLQHLLGSLGGTLAQIVIVGIHTGYHILAHPLEHISDSRLLATVEMIIAGRQHDFEIARVILILSQHRPPEEDIIVALDVSHNLAPSLLRGHPVGCLEELGIDIIG